jgi:hypothetical protein
MSDETKPEWFVEDQLEKHPWLLSHLTGVNEEDARRIVELKNRISVQSEQIQRRLTISGDFNSVTNTVKQYGNCDDSVKQFLANTVNVDKFEGLFFVYSQLNDLLKEDFAPVLVADKLAEISTKKNRPAYSMVVVGTPSTLDRSKTQLHVFGEHLSLEYPSEYKMDIQKKEHNVKRFVNRLGLLLKREGIDNTENLNRLERLLQEYKKDTVEGFSKGLTELVFQDLTKRTFYFTLSEIQPLLKEILSSRNVYETFPTILPQTDLLVKIRGRYHDQGLQNKVIFLTYADMQQCGYELFPKPKKEEFRKKFIFANRTPFYDYCGCEDRKLMNLTYTIHNGKIETYYDNDGICDNCQGQKKGEISASVIAHDSIMAPALISLQTKGIRVARGTNEDIASMIFYNSLLQNARNVWELKPENIWPYVVSGGGKFLGYHGEDHPGLPENSALMFLFGKNDVSIPSLTYHDITVKNQTYR